MFVICPLIKSLNTFTMGVCLFVIDFVVANIFLLFIGREFLLDILFDTVLMSDCFIFIIFVCNTFILLMIM